METRRFDRLAPSDRTPVDYDRHHLALYAAILDADDAGRDWREAAADLMRLNPSEGWAEACWRSHLERARWIVAEGLGPAIVTFNTPPISRS